MNVGSLSIMLMANTTGLVAGTKAVYTMERQMAASSASMNAAMASSAAAAVAFGRSLTQSVTLPVALIGTVSVKSFSEFEYNLAKVSGLIGIAREQTNAFGSEILKLGSSLGRSPKELSQALYTVTTSGMRGANVMDVLTQSTKGAIAGLGTVAQVADITTSAMNAYGKENLSAAQTLDIVTATVREGKAEADKLVTAMGVATPIAAKMGVGLDQVGAAMAAMTRTGTLASTSATQLRQMLFTFIKPSEMAKNKLKELGSSFGELRKIIREEGLMAALIEVERVTGGLPENMAAIFRNVRALSGVTDVLGEHFEENLALFERIKNSSGNLNTAFLSVADTIKIRLTKVTARWQEQMIVLGEFLSKSLVPILETLMSVIEGIGWFFGKMPSFLQNFLAGLVGLIAVAAPLVLVFTGLKSAIVALWASLKATLGFTAIAETFSAMGLAAAPLGVIIGEVVLVIGALIAAYHLLKFAFFDVSNANKYFKEAMENSANSVIEERQNIQSLLQIINSNVLAIEDKKEALDRLIAINPEYFKGLTMDSVLTDAATKSAEKYVKTLEDLERVKQLVDAKQKIKQELIQKVAGKSERIVFDVNKGFTTKTPFFEQLGIDKFKREADKAIEKINKELIPSLQTATVEYRKLEEGISSRFQTNKEPAKLFGDLAAQKTELLRLQKIAQGIIGEDAKNTKAKELLDYYSKSLSLLNERKAVLSEVLGLNKEEAFLDPDDLQKMNDYADSLAHIQMLLGYLGKEYDAIGASISVYMQMLESGLYSDEKKQEIANTILKLKAQQKAQEELKQKQDKLVESSKNYADALQKINLNLQLFGSTYDSLPDRLSALQKRYNDLADGAKTATPEMQRLATAIMDVQSAIGMGGKMQSISINDIFKEPAGFTRIQQQIMDMQKGSKFEFDKDGKIKNLTIGLQTYKEVSEEIFNTDKAIANSIQDVFQGMSNVITNALSSTENVFEAFAKFFGDFIKGMIFKLIAATIAALALVAVISLIPGLGTLSKGFGAINNALQGGNFGKALLGGLSVLQGGVGLASGGIVPPGFPNDTFKANLSSNEAVIPLDRMPQMLGFRKNKSTKNYFVLDGHVAKVLVDDAEKMKLIY